MSNCYHCRPDPCICRHLGEVMTQPQRANWEASGSVRFNLSAIENEFSPKITGIEAWWLPDMKINYGFDASKKAWDDAVQGYVRMFEPGGALSRDADRVKWEFERPPGLNSGVATSNHMEILCDLARAGAIGGSGDYEFAAGDADTNALPKTQQLYSLQAGDKPFVGGPDLDDDYSDFLDNDEFEDDDE